MHIIAIATSKIRGTSDLRLKTANNRKRQTIIITRKKANDRHFSLIKNHKFII